MDLVEREPELRALHGHLRRVASGTGHTVLLGGEAGIGKTSLLQALAEQRGDAVLWWGACDDLQTPHPFTPLHDIARSADVSFRAVLLEVGSRASLFEAVLAELQRSRQPVLVVIEDAHWADDATLDMLKFVSRRIDATASPGQSCSTSWTHNGGTAASVVTPCRAQALMTSRGVR